nr:MAG TPA: hypothetical protein [Caudoviricetes sp.]
MSIPPISTGTVLGSLEKQCFSLVFQGSRPKRYRT